MFKKSLIKCLYLFFILVFLFSNICYAAADNINEENLNEVFEKFASSSANELNYNVTMSNNAIEITSEDENYNLNYDLTDKPTFSLEIPIEKGMSYDDFEKKTGNIIAPFMIAYTAVANIKGVYNMEDAYGYFFSSYLDNLSNSSTNNTTVIDDVLKFVKDTYAEKKSISDSKNINSYLLTIETLDVTDTSCKLVYKLKINIDADFSKLIGYIASEMDSDITKENADLVVTLKVGQKCKIETTEEITGRVFLGYNCIEFDKKTAEITAKSVGIKNGYLYFGEETTKTIYITVEENTENDSLETIIVKIDSEPEVKPPVTSEEEEKTQNKGETKEDNTQTSSKMPQTGIDRFPFISIVIFFIIIITIGTKLKKYKNI